MRPRRGRERRRRTAYLHVDLERQIGAVLGASPGRPVVSHPGLVSGEALRRNADVDVRRPLDDLVQTRICGGRTSSDATARRERALLLGMRHRMMSGSLP